MDKHSKEIVLSSAAVREDRENCRQQIISEDYMDFIIEEHRVYNMLEQDFADFCRQQMDLGYHSIYLPGEKVEPLKIEENSYTAIPNCYTLLDSSSMEAAGISNIHSNPLVNLQGEGIMIGFIDTGIDYQNDVFRNIDGTTRIEAIWDQTVQTGNMPDQFSYGSVYNRAQINGALSGDNPLDIVPSVDEHGHGTYLASLAAGGEIKAENFIGAAPQATLAVVKLKQAKKYLRDFYFIPDEASAYQENDIMLAVNFLENLAGEKGMPLVLCIALGTNLGDHNGASSLSNYLNILAYEAERAVIIGAGNEANEGHHYSGDLGAGSQVDNVEVRVAENVKGFVLELWGQAPDIFSISIISPTGERVPTLPPKEGSQELNFIFEQTKIYVDYRIVEGAEGIELIFIRFETPTPGIWKLEVKGNQTIEGRFHIWLPVKEFLTAPVFFLRSDPEATITEPGCAVNPITVGAYNHRTNSILIESGRGFTRLQRIKPNFAAPGAEVFGAFPGNRYGTLTGTSGATAIAAGAAALIMEWGVIRNGNRRMNSAEIKGILVRGAIESSERSYPSREWGYGSLNVYNAFERIRNP